MPRLPEDDLTIEPPMVQTAPLTPTPPPKTSRFAPGSIIAARYRLVALLGRGGMGEVYRADDLTLDQPVALKFLPEGVAADPMRLAQFHNELRVARQVSHKNVCRLYDLGDADGRRFLTMEYVDGEDLASLLRRIGRFPQDKAIDVARQLCAGIAAAHERGVIHRDLKPANVMIDGDGNVRITDFGIATVAIDVGVDVAGTPQYMAPELLAGKPASTRSDIYALGLILFEIVTGRRPYDAKTLGELKQLHDTGTVTTPSAIVRDLDPAVERIILRCLARDPDQRPASALAVAVALPGGDPLAAALAAGETPSPDMVAAAGETDAWPVAKGLSALAFVAIAILLCAGFAGRTTLARLLPLDKPPAVLEDRAEQILGMLGYTEPRGDTAYGFGRYAPYIPWIGRRDSSPTRWNILGNDRPPAFIFWYRTSPRDFAPRQLALHVTPSDPPQSDTDMHTVTIDMRGRLIGFSSVPRQFDDAPATGAESPPWPRLFEAAELPLAAFTPVAPQWAPRDFADARAAWEGPLPGSDVRVRVEAAAYRGRAVSFLLIGPWTVPTRMQSFQRPLSDRIGLAILVTVTIVLLAGAVMLARYNVRLGRADRRGATRVAVFVVCTELAAWLTGYHHVPDLRTEMLSFGAIASDAIALGVVLWIIYAALEPYARRFWPEMLLGWSRLLSGHVRDPRVGRDVLLGVAFGVAWFGLDIVRRLLPQAFGYPATVPRLGDATTLFGAAQTVSTWSTVILRDLQIAFGAVLLFVVLRLITRRASIAIALGMTIVLYWWSSITVTPVLWIEVTYEIIVVAMFTFVLIRYGLLAAAVARILAGLCEAIPFTLQVSHWSATPSNWTVAAIVLLAVFGFYASRAGEPLFGTFTPP
ncbi:MAG TPA: serine/threonine-protein kinase [Vicinamibacterales bacterium]|nr:serine/threonine-protein kinase [Vicinamibacterales bacterium]